MSINILLLPTISALELVWFANRTQKNIGINKPKKKKKMEGVAVPGPRLCFGPELPRNSRAAWSGRLPLNEICISFWMQLIFLFICIFFIIGCTFVLTFNIAVLKAVLYCKFVISNFTNGNMVSFVLNSNYDSSCCGILFPFTAKEHRGWTTTFFFEEILIFVLSASLEFILST